MGCINFAKKVQGLKANQKLLYIMIADRAEIETGVCKTPIFRLARDCGGWTRQTTNRILRELYDLDLVDVQPQFPGTSDPARMLILNLAIDPDEWRPPKGKGRKKQTSLEPYYVNSSDFKSFLRSHIKNDPKKLHDFEIWLAPLRIVEFRPPFIVCGLPDEGFARQVWDNWRELIITVAREKVSPNIKKLRLIYPKTRKKVLK